MKKDNKGFSLVELIIVIAIMAILVGIVGSQVLPYLNKSREAKDQQILSSWVTAALSAYSSNAATLTGTSYTIDITPAAGGTVAFTPTTTAGPQQVLETAFNELAAPSGAKFSSKLYQSIDDIKILITPTDTSYVVRISNITFGHPGAPTNATINTSELVAK